MVNTKYGLIDNDKFEYDLNAIGNRVFKLLCRKEEGVDIETLNTSILSIIFEIKSYIDILCDNNHVCSILMTVVRNLNGLIDVDDMVIFRKKIMRSRSLIERASKAGKLGD